MTEHFRKDWTPVKDLGNVFWGSLLWSCRKEVDWAPRNHVRSPKNVSIIQRGGSAGSLEKKTHRKLIWSSLFGTFQGREAGTCQKYFQVTGQVLSLVGESSWGLSAVPGDSRSGIFLLALISAREVLCCSWCGFPLGFVYRGTRTDHRGEIFWLPPSLPFLPSLSFFLFLFLPFLLTSPFSFLFFWLLVFLQIHISEQIARVEWVPVCG